MKKRRKMLGGGGGCGDGEEDMGMGTFSVFLSSGVNVGHK